AARRAERCRQRRALGRRDRRAGEGGREARRVRGTRPRRRRRDESLGRSQARGVSAGNRGAPGRAGTTPTANHDRPAARLLAAKALLNLRWHRHSFLCALAQARMPVPPRKWSPSMAQPAARVTDMHVCPMVTVLVPHVGGPILPPGGIPVLIGGLPAARVGDMATCVGPPDVIALGSFTVLIGGQPAARMGDLTAHGGSIVLGCFTVLIN